MVKINRSFANLNILSNFHNLQFHSLCLILYEILSISTFTMNVLYNVYDQTRFSLIKLTCQRKKKH